MKTIIIYEDKDIIIVQKPAGLATQTAKIGQADVVSELKNHLAAQNRDAVGRKQEIYLGVVHRLDQPVEGLLVFAKNKTAAASLTKQLATGILNKQYYAVICGQPSAKEGELVDYLLKEDNLARVVTGQQSKFAEAKKAILQYKIMQEKSTPEQLALVDIHIDTGRFHQIRVQMSHAGMPLLGDAKYGDTQVQELGRRLAVRNVALCAYDLALKHPVTGKQMSFQIKPVGKAFTYFNENNF